MDPTRRRTPGLSSLSTSRLQTHHYTTHGTRLRNLHAETLSNQLSVFQSLLHNFALTHAKDIRANPEFRAEFARMCSALGIDFLASSYHKDGGGGGGGGGQGGLGSIWAQLLGGSVHDFYFNLGVRIVEECRETRSENGGLISIGDLQARLEAPPQFASTADTSTSSSATTTTGPRLIRPSLPSTPDDIKRAVAALAPLGSCISITTIGHRELIRSVPQELNTDQNSVLEAIQVLGYVTVSMLQVNLGWEKERACAVVEDLMAGSLVWVDAQAEGGEMEYWSPAFLTGGGG